MPLVGVYSGELLPLDLSSAASLRSFHSGYPGHGQIWRSRYKLPFFVTDPFVNKLECLLLAVFSSPV
jgi:hypothetical protein